MSHGQDDNVHYFQCDICGEEFDGEPDETFQESWESARGYGWRSFQRNNEWQHRCPDCVGKEAA